MRSFRHPVNWVCFALFAVISGDYCVVKFVRTYSMYSSTPPCGGQITPCTNPKFRAKRRGVMVLGGLECVERIEEIWGDLGGFLGVFGTDVIKK